MKIPAKVYVEGHGCSASLADTEIIQGLVSQDGYELVDDESEADVRVLVTCSVKSVTEQRMISRIKELSQDGKKLVVAGCLPKADPSKIESINSNLSMIGPGNLDRLLPTISTTLLGEKEVSLEPNKLVKVGLPRTRKNNLVGIVEISSGCLSSCTFCQVKLVKGIVFSYPEEAIVEECRRLISQRVKEIWLTSTDNAAYGRDSKTSLPSLVRKVSSIPGDFKIRIGMMNPLLTDGILNELVDCFKSEKVFKFLHLPVQSGSERILKLMQRGYSLDDFYETVSVFRRAIPEISLSTDMIVGFPSETEEEFQESIELLRKVNPDVVNLSRFGARPGTKAACMDSQVSSRISKERSTRMTSSIKEITRKRNEQWIGWSGKVLVDEIVKNAVVGRNFTYKSCLFKVSNQDTIEKMMGNEIRCKVFDATASTLRVVEI